MRWLAFLIVALGLLLPPGVCTCPLPSEATAEGHCCCHDEPAPPADSDEEPGEPTGHGPTCRCMESIAKPSLFEWDAPAIVAVPLLPASCLTPASQTSGTIIVAGSRAGPPVPLFLTLCHLTL